MATLLAYVATDARLTPAATRAALAGAVSRSFNCVTVDGDTSTNDSCLLMATAQVGSQDIDPEHGDYAPVAEAIESVCRELAHPAYREERGAAVVAQPEFTIGIGLGRGSAEATVWTCDFSYDYVKINAEYRT